MSFSTEEIIENEKKSLGITDFLNSAREYTNKTFEDINIDDLFSDLIKGKFSTSSIRTKIFKIFSNELLETSIIMLDILIVIIIHSILNAIIEDLGNSNVAKIAYFIQYLIIATLIIKASKNIILLTTESIKNINNFMNLLVPLLITLSITTGAITTANLIQPILLLVINISSNFITNFILPFVTVTIVLAIISNISEKVQIGKLSKFFKSSVIWILGIILTIFVGVLSLEGTLGSSVDGLTTKTAKAAVSNLIPVVGKILGDSVDTVIGCANILKNTVGLIGVIVILAIVINPLIKIVILWFYFKITSAICEIIADKKITNLIEQISDGYKILLGVLSSVCVMFIIGITLVLKITNSSLMYK
ncbi:MAG: stage III sporulation protein AE [Candidatus Scatovivens sp.]